VAGVSVQAISWAYSCSELSDVYETVALVTLANFADEYGVCWPSQATLAQYCRCSERKLRECLKALEERGVLIRLKRWRDNGAQRSDAFVLIGFIDRKVPATDDEHPILAQLDFVPGSVRGFDTGVVADRAAESGAEKHCASKGAAPCAKGGGTLCQGGWHTVPGGGGTACHP
jgi:hypothetical protein